MVMHQIPRIPESNSAQMQGFGINIRLVCIFKPLASLTICGSVCGRLGSFQHQLYCIVKHRSMAPSEPWQTFCQFKTSRWNNTMYNSVRNYVILLLCSVYFLHSKYRVHIYSTIPGYCGIIRLFSSHWFIIGPSQELSSFIVDKQKLCTQYLSPCTVYSVQCASYPMQLILQPCFAQIQI